MMFSQASSIVRMDRTYHRAKAVYPRNALGLFLLLIFIFSSRASQRASVTLGWDEVGGINLSGYTVYYGTNTLQYSASHFVTVPTATISGLIPGEAYYFAVSANSSAGLQSPLSEEIVVEIPEVNIALGFLPPRLDATMLRMWFYPVANRRHELQTSTDLKNWAAIAVLPPTASPGRYDFVDYPASSERRSRYYRVMVSPR
jgi:hypothetical protein